MRGRIKERSSSYAQALLLALLMLQSCSSSEGDRQIGTPPPVRMKFHKLKVEPQVHSSYPTYRRYHDGLAPQVVVITVMRSYRFLLESSARIE